jgi:uncharacterized protein (DUF1501 family)
VIGNSVKGGFHGAFPDLANLDHNRHMVFTVDYRSLYATLLDRWLSVPSGRTDSLLGAPYPRLGFL